MKVQVLYFEGCPNHEPTLALIREVAAETGTDVTVETVEVGGAEDVERLRFFGSPTVQVDGVDVDPSARNSTNYAFGCRMYGTSGVPSKKLLVEALSKRSTE